MDAVVAGVVAAFSYAGVAPGTVYATLDALVRELRDSVKCDYIAVQTCSRWRVHLLHGILIAAAWFAAWGVLCAALGASFLATLTVPLFAVVVMTVCYGYQWSCAPMVPVCFFEDAVAAVRMLLPRQMAVPDALLFDSARCQQEAAAPSAQCIRSCMDAPLDFGSWYAPLAWLAAEAGLVELPWLRWVPMIDADALQLELGMRAAIFAGADNDLKTANRLCTVFSVHLLVPFFLFFMLGFILASAVLRSLAALLSSALLLVGLLFASASTDDDEAQG